MGNRVLLNSDLCVFCGHERRSHNTDPLVDHGYCVGNDGGCRCVGFDDGSDPYYDYDDEDDDYEDYYRSEYDDDN